MDDLGVPLFSETAICSGYHPQPSFLGVMTVMTHIFGTENFHVSWFWRPKVEMSTWTGELWVNIPVPCSLLVWKKNNGHAEWRVYTHLEKKRVHKHSQIRTRDALWNQSSYLQIVPKNSATTGYRRCNFAHSERDSCGIGCCMLCFSLTRHTRW